MHILDDFMVWTLHEQPEPRINLLGNCLLRELVALQALGTTGGGIGMTCRGMPHAENAPLPLGE